MHQGLDKKNKLFCFKYQKSPAATFIINLSNRKPEHWKRHDIDIISLYTNIVYVCHSAYSTQPPLLFKKKKTNSNSKQYNKHVCKYNTA